MIQLEHILRFLKLFWTQSANNVVTPNGTSNVYNIYAKKHLSMLQSPKRVPENEKARQEKKLMLSNCLSNEAY